MNINDCGIIGLVDFFRVGLVSNIRILTFLLKYELWDRFYRMIYKYNEMIFEKVIFKR